MFNQYLTIFITAMLPISELRGAIPVGLVAFKLSPALVYTIAVLGNILPIFLLLLIWQKGVEKLADKYVPLGKLLHWLFERTRKKFYANHKRFGHWALILFVAIPLPITGAWSGSIAAWLFGIPYWKAMGLIFSGILISGLIVSAITLGIVSIT
jgi:uncharacterized membrane protein